MVSLPWRNCVFLAIVAMPYCAMAKAQDVDFQTHRHEDDLSIARIRAEAGDDTLKAIPVGESAWLSLGGELRLRLEQVSSPGLGASGSTADTYGLHRALVHADLQANENIRVFVQFGAFIAPGKTAAAPPAMDKLDLQQSFVDLSAPVGPGRITTRIGRQEIAFGSQRLIGLRDGPNARRNFDGVRLTYLRGDARADLIFLRPVEQRKGIFDNGASHGDALSGAYATLPNIGAAGSLDVYLLHYERSDAIYSSFTGRENRWSSGMRYFGDARGWDWDVEATLQSGDAGTQDISAWGVATNSGYTLPQGTWRLRLGTKIDIASGDKDPADGALNTGNALYPMLPYLGSSAAFAPSNIIDIHPELTVARNAAKVTLGYQAIWRQTVADAVYIAPLIPLDGTAGNGGRFTAHQWTVDGAWSVSPSIRLEAALAWVDVADSLERLGFSDSVLSYAAVIWRF